MQNFAFQCQRCRERFTLTLTLDLRFEFNVADGNFTASARYTNKFIYVQICSICISIYIYIYIYHTIYLHLLFSSRIVSFIFELRWVCKNSHKIFNFHFYVRSKKTREKSNKNTYPYTHSPILTYTPILTHTHRKWENIQNKTQIFACCVLWVFARGVTCHGEGGGKWKWYEGWWSVPRAGGRGGTALPGCCSVWHTLRCVARRKNTCSAFDCRLCFVEYEMRVSVCVCMHVWVCVCVQYCKLQGAAKKFTLQNN